MKAEPVTNDGERSTPQQPSKSRDCEERLRRQFARQFAAVRPALDSLRRAARTMQPTLESLRRTARRFGPVPAQFCRDAAAARHIVKRASTRRGGLRRRGHHGRAPRRRASRDGDSADDDSEGSGIRSGVAA